MSDRSRHIGAVLIGRNEGARLECCLSSVVPIVDRAVYVDSGSTDGSVRKAMLAGAEVVNLGLERPFTAARARNAGFDRLLQGGSFQYVQFIDGDCELQPGWIETASAFLDAHPGVAVVQGRVRERHPEATIYNWLCDMEWQKELGESRACGGIAMMRADVFRAAGGFDARLIAGEEPELCVRLRAAGWKIWSLPDEMVLHDAGMTRFSQWWRRTLRGGHAFAEGAAMHGGPPERHKVRETRRALVWGLGIPVAALLGLLVVSPWALTLLILWPAQIVRMMLQGRPPLQAVFLILGRIPEALGVLHYWAKRLTRREARLIEYK